jgi:hypothetical protein
MPRSLSSRLRADPAFKEVIEPPVERSGNLISVREAVKTGGDTCRRLGEADFNLKFYEIWFVRSSRPIDDGVLFYNLQLI